ncbi:MAG: hypothetical protein L6Q68_07795 [Aquabacterium sp.]|jgi:hypothetical protein|nr:hypothetical protein [Aquabacterium sp.]
MKPRSAGGEFDRTVQTIPPRRWFSGEDIPMVQMPAAIAQGDSPPGQRVSNPTAKEFVMNETLELEFTDLGDAKEVTKGTIDPQNSEEHPVLSRRLEN